jgi:hypothetical protein
VLLIASLTIQKVVFESRYAASEHAAGHLGGSTAIFLGGPVALILLWLLAGDRRRPLVLLGTSLWLAGLVGVLVGNVRVVDAIGSANWSDAEASVLGPSRPGFESGHDLADVASLLAVAGALVVVGAVWRVGRVSTRVAIVSAALCVLTPPWIFPGAGVIILTLTFAWRRSRAPECRFETSGSRFT